MQARGVVPCAPAKRWGGYEMDIGTYFEVQMALAEGCMSTAWVYGVVGVHPWLIALFDDRAADDVWGKDDMTLICSSLMPVGVATPVEGGFRLQRPLEIFQRQRSLRLGVPRRHDRGPAAAPDRTFLLPRSDYEIVDTWHVLGPEGHRQPRHRGQGRVRAGLPDAPQYSDNFSGWAPGPGGEHGALYRLPFGPGVLPRRLDRRDRRAARHARRLSRLRQEAHQRMRRERRSEDAGSRSPAPRSLSAIDEMKTILHRNLHDAGGYAARGEMPPLKQRIEYKFHSAGGGRCSLLAVAAVQGGRHRRHHRGPAVRPDPRRHHRRASARLQPIRAAHYGATLFGIENNKDFVL